MLISKSVPFAFRQRRERIDWKKLASVDVDKVAREVDIEILQVNTSNVTFCDIHAELEPNSLDPNFIKLFRLAQLIIEYLMYSQECLSSALSSQEQQLLEKKKQIDDLKMKLEKQMVKMQKVEEKQSYFILNGGGQHQCNYCPKLFLNETFLHLHIQRRHPEHASNTAVGVSGPNNAVEKELCEIKEQLKATESRLLAERTAVENAAVKERIEYSKRETELSQEMERWKAEQAENHRKELSNVREQFLNELKIVHEKFLSSEKQLQDLKIKSENVSHSVLVVDQETNAEIVKFHQQEMAEMKYQFKDQMGNFERIVQQQFKEQDEHWRRKLQQLVNDHNEEMRKLTDVLYTKINTVPTLPQRQQITENESKLTRQIEALEKQNRRLRQKQVHQGKQLQEFLNNSVEQNSFQLPKHYSTPIPNESSLQLHSSIEEKPASNLSLENVQEVTNHSLPKFESALRNNPNIIQGMREEVSNLLEEKLERIGISRNIGGVKDSTLNNKLASQHSERQNLIKRYKSLLSLREQLQHQVEWIAQSKIKKSKTEPSTPLRAKKSLKKLFSSVKERVKSVSSRSRSHSPQGRVSLSSLETTTERNFKTLPDGVFGSHANSDEDSGSSFGKDSKLKLSSAFDADINKKSNANERDYSSESEDSSDDMPARKLAEPVVTLRPPQRSVIPRSPSIAQLATTLERQLEDRKSKPVGGVDLLSAKHVVKEKMLDSAYVASAVWDQNSNGFSASIEEIFNATSHNNRVTTHKGDTENSSNTGATSAWNSSSSKPAVNAKHTGTTSGPSSSLVSVSSWDSENDFSDLG